MTNIRRYWQKGNIYFLTNVTLDRKRILVENADLFCAAVKKINKLLPFELIAHIILPDHFHFLIDPKESDLSLIIRRIKLSFSSSYRLRKGMKSGRVWQYRFWDHIIRNQDDLNNHIDYIHYNPVNHGYVGSPFEWEQSSIGEFYKHGLYSDDWGVIDRIKFRGEFGE